VNEPWWLIPLDELKDFYWESYKIVQKQVPAWITLFHDSFRLWPSNFGGDWMHNCSNWAMDTHLYLAWADPNIPEAFVDSACGEGSNLKLMESLGVPVVVGEWSLATDNCAMWLNGFNDNVPGFPKVACERVSCLTSYMAKQHGAPPMPNPAIDSMDPRGSSGESFMINGTCPVSGDSHPDPQTVRALANAQLNAFDSQTHGNFFWNFRTELEPLWDYQEAVKRGWMPTDWSDHSAEQLAIDSACLFVEDNESSVLSQYNILYWNYLGVAFMLFLVIKVWYIRRFVSSCWQRLARPSAGAYQPIPAANGHSDIELQTQEEKN